MNKSDKAGIICCSNARPQSEKKKIQNLEKVLRDMGLTPVFSDRIYTGDMKDGITGRERAEQLMNFYRDDSIREIFDISGGDIANEILPYLDYQVIAGTDKRFFGYSDLTTVIQAVYTKTGKESVLYQVKNLVGESGEIQRQNFRKFLSHTSEELTEFEYQFIQKETMQGVVVGGNIRCLLKLAGTEYWPDMQGKILLLEAFRGRREQMIAYLSQLKQIGVFHQIAGILLGTFSAMEEEAGSSVVCELVKDYAGPDLPIAKTQEIGHGEDSKGIIIGKYLELDGFS